MSKKTRRTEFGSVTPRKDGRWEGAVTIGYNENGNPVRRRVYGATRAEASEKLKAILTQISLGVSPQQDRQTVAEFLDFWMKEHVSHLEPKTRRGYEQIVRLYLKPHIGRFRLAHLTAQHVQAMLNRLGTEGTAPGARPLSPQSVRLTRAALRAALNLAWKWGLVRENVAARTTPPKSPQHEVDFLTVVEAQALVQASRDHYMGGLIQIALLTGLRLGEATGLVWEDVDMEQGCIRVRCQLQRVEGTLVRKSLKSRSSRRTLSLSEAGRQALARQRELQRLWRLDADPDAPFNPLDLCFTNEQGKPLDPKTVDENLKKLCAKAGVKRISFHKLRHTLATHLVASGESLAVVKDQLGHSQIGLTLNTYSHAVPAALKRAADKAEELFGG